ncbi:MAG: response regulator [Patescibacteria group bacterium]
MRILVVEDNKKHMQDAVAAAKEFDIELVTATTVEEASRMLRPSDILPAVDGVVTDLFMPFTSRPPYNADDQPCGLSVVLKAQKAGIPVIICTAGSHHGIKYQWVCDLGRSLGWPEMADSSFDNYKDAETKNWQGAFKKLLGIITGEKESDEE